MWDNTATQHCAINDYGDERRVVRRSTIMGEAPVGVDGRTSVTKSKTAKPAAPARARQSAAAPSPLPLRESRIAQQRDPGEGSDGMPSGDAEKRAGLARALSPGHPKSLRDLGTPSRPSPSRTSL